MENLAEIRQEMMEGLQSIDSYWANRKLSTGQYLYTKLSLALVLLLKYTYKPIRDLIYGKFDITEGLESHTGLSLAARGSKRQETDGGNFLNKEEVATFERTGILGPFKVMEAAEAEDLARYSYELYDRRFDHQHIVGGSKEILDILEREGLASISYLSAYQALNYHRLWDVLCHPAIAQRMTSLLGDDVICWRSQFFEKKAGAEATSWHQAGTFREASDIPKLTAPPGMGLGMVQLSVWVALTDVTKENGCLRLVEGSHADGRLELLAWKIMDNKLNFLLSQSPKMIETIIKTLRYTPGVFQKTQMLFEMCLDMLPDLFAGTKVRSLEMKAGEAIIFTSLAVHGSFPNVCDQGRLALSGRYTSNDVVLYKDAEYDSFPTPRGKVRFKVDKVACIQVAGTDKFGHNRIAKAPADRPLVTA